MTPFARDNLKPLLSGRKILLGVSGSIAAFKTCEIVRQLRDCGAQVRVVLTDNAQKFVTPLTLETLSGKPVLTSLWSGGHGTHHIDTARWAEVALVAPATANTIAKIALGLADDLLTTELLAATCPICVAPAMNPAMYANPAVQANVATLRSRGVHLFGPASGLTACGEEGEGRMLEPGELVERLAQTLVPRRSGRRLVLTLGPTRSAIDPVRYVTNRSSGLMGAAIAWAAWRAGYEVTAVCGPTDAPLPLGARVVRVQTAQEMAAAALSAWTDSDVFVGAAAVLDWDVANPAAQKLKKEKGQAPSLEFTRNTDILAEAARRRRPGQYVVGFAAETEAPLENGRAKLAAKGCDALFANDVSRPGQGFESLTNAGWWITTRAADALAVLPCSKVELASRLVDLIDKARSGRDAAAHRGEHDEHAPRVH